MKQAHIKKILSYLRLNDKEAEIYLALLASKKTVSVSELEKKISLGRTAIYFHVKSLLEKDIIREDKSNRIKKFRAVSPMVLSRRLSHWASDFHSILPELEGLSMLDNDIPETTVKEIKHSHYEFYSELANLPSGSEFRVIQGKRSGEADISNMTDAQWQTIFYTMCENKIVTRALFSTEMIKIAKQSFTPKTQLLFKKRIWHLRSIQEAVHDYEEMFIYGDKVSFFLTDVGVILTIHHKRIARALTAMFDALWITGRARTWDDV